MSRTPREYTIAELEQLTVELPSFTKEDAFRLGTIAAEVIREWDVSLAVDIVIEGDLVFRAKLGSTGPGNDAWLQKKAEATRRFDAASLLVRLRREQGVLDAEDDEAVAFYGGSIPIHVGGVQVATITMSGEPDVVDHETCAEAVGRYLAEVAAA